MDYNIADIFIEWFEILEQNVIDYLKYVPPISNNLNVFSPRLATVNMETCGIIDSILRYHAPSEFLFNSKIICKNNYNMEHYAHIYESRLSGVKIIHLQSPPVYVQPFSSWLKRDKPSPNWWSVHNGLKHNRVDIAKLQKATLGNALDSLAALLAVLSINEELVDAMVRRQWLQEGGNNSDLIHKSVDNPAKNFPFTFCTSRFALIIGKELPENIKDFSPSDFAGGKKLRNHFGRSHQDFS